jgi:hypothetical protein
MSRDSTILKQVDAYHIRVAPGLPYWLYSCTTIVVGEFYELGMGASLASLNYSVIFEPRSETVVIPSRVDIILAVVESATDVLGSLSYDAARTFRRVI